jgi:hypothetical protein
VRSFKARPVEMLRCMIAATLTEELQSDLVGAKQGRGEYDLPLTTECFTTECGLAGCSSDSITGLDL